MATEKPRRRHRTVTKAREYGEARGESRVIRGRAGTAKSIPEELTTAAGKRAYSDCMESGKGHTVCLRVAKKVQEESKKK